MKNLNDLRNAITNEKVSKIKLLHKVTEYNSHAEQPLLIMIKRNKWNEECLFIETGSSYMRFIAEGRCYKFVSEYLRPETITGLTYY